MMMKILLFLLLTGAGAGAFVAPAGHSSSESPSSTEIKATTKSKSLWIADTTSRYPYIDEIDGTVEYERVPWQVLNFWLSELNGNIHVNNTVCEGVEREKIVQELVSRWDYTREKEERDESLSSELGYGLDWKEYENSQGYTHFEELLIYQPKEWRKLARDYIYHHEWDLERMSYSTMRKVEKKYLTDDGSEEMMTIPMHKPALVVLFHPDMRRTRRYEALNFLLAYGVENPLISLFSGMNAMQKHLVMKELSPLDYFIDFQQRVQSYSLDMLREVGKRCAFPRIPLIKELDVSNVVGQRLAKHVIRQQVVKYILKRSVEDEHGCTRQPLSMIFAGPSGNGKTELAMRLAQLLNQPGEDSFLKIDCGKLTTSHEVFGMSGAYYGSREDSALNNFVLRMSQRPESVGVVLLDEIEKAGEDVIYGLYQVIDKAEWTNKKMSEGKDGHTETVSCFNIIFIMIFWTILNPTTFIQPMSWI